MFKNILLAAVCFAALLFGQSDRATITGTVTDPTGAAVPKVQVNATDVATNVKTHLLSKKSKFQNPNIK